MVRQPVDALAAQVVETGMPAQAVYLLERPSRPGPKDLVSALAFMVKNLVRPSGLGRLGLPCLLTGTGMAFPWETIRAAKLASGNIVEDMQLGLDLALAGHAPLFCEQARVTGKLPEQSKAAVSQRTRWEHGHLQTLITQVPRLLTGAMRKRRFGALALALELAVPP
ncbi:MAG TPA: glycosyltransferase, partial [Longimicrobiaceae bacterium]|nr:glycosyltransferase [Longimicrobiaceae bacterium]